MKKLFETIMIGLFFAVCAMTNAFADEIKDKAIADFENVTMVNIAKMAPYISQSAQARAQAFPDNEAMVKSCSDADSVAYKADEYLAKSAALICQSLALWMNDGDAITCKYLTWVEESEAMKKDNNRKVLKTYKKANLGKVIQDLTQAAGCNSKDKTYWAKRVLTDYKAMTAFIGSDAQTRTSAQTQELKRLDRDCYFADSLASDFSKVEAATYYGCTAIGFHTKISQGDPCKYWFEARNIARTIKEGEPLFDELLALRVSFLDLSGKTNCEAKVQDLLAKRGEVDQISAQNAAIQEQVNGLLNSYAIARRSADSNMALVNAWEGRSYDNKYLTKDENKTREEARKEVIGIVCRYYQYTRNDVVNAQSAASQIYKLQPNDANRARFQSEINNMKFLNTEVNNWCN